MAEQSTVMVVEYTLEGMERVEVEDCLTEIRRAVERVRARHARKVAISEAGDDISHEVSDALRRSRPTPEGTDHG